LELEVPVLLEELDPVLEVEKDEVLLFDPV
jgi:hypothetical protein